MPAFADVWTPVTRAKAAGLLERIHASAARIGTVPILEAGSLLGHERHDGGIVPWDDDIDLIVEDAAFDRLIERLADDPALRVAGVEHHVLGEYGNVSWRADPSGLVSGSSRPWGWPFVDLFRYSLRGDQLVLYPGSKVSRTLDAADVLPSRASSFVDTAVHVPRRPDRVLDALYPLWRIEFDTGGWDHRREAPRERTVVRWNPAGVDPLPPGRVVYTDMCADLFHAGHVNFLRQAKALGDRLVVGVHDDRTIASYKAAPIQTLAERVAVVAACRFVDQVVPHAPLEVSPRYLDQLDVQVVCHADDLTAAARDRMYGEILATREFAWIPYTPGISTRALRDRVLDAHRQSSGETDACGDSRQ